MRKSTEMLPPSICQKGRSQKWFPLPYSVYTAFSLCEMLQQGKGVAGAEGEAEPVSGVGVLDLWRVGSFPGASQNNLSWSYLPFPALKFVGLWSIC